MGKDEQRHSNQTENQPSRQQLFHLGNLYIYGHTTTFMQNSKSSLIQTLGGP